MQWYTSRCLCDTSFTLDNAYWGCDWTVGRFSIVEGLGAVLHCMCVIYELFAAQSILFTCTRSFCDAYGFETGIAEALFGIGTTVGSQALSCANDQQTSTHMLAETIILLLTLFLIDDIVESNTYIASNSHCRACAQHVACFTVPPCCIMIFCWQIPNNVHSSCSSCSLSGGHI